MCRHEMNALEGLDKARADWAIKLTSSVSLRAEGFKSSARPTTLDEAQEELSRAVEHVCSALKEKTAERVRPLNDLSPVC
jgi:hypothetical protein